MRVLTRKEKRMAIFAAIFIAGWSLYAFCLRPAQARLETLARVIPKKQAELQELKHKANTVAELRLISHQETSKTDP